MKPLFQTLARLSGRVKSLSQTLARLSGKLGFDFSWCFGSIQRGRGQQWRSLGLVSCGAGLQQSRPKHRLPPEFMNSLAGSRAPNEGVEQGPGPGDLGGGLVPAEQGCRRSHRWPCPALSR